MNSFSHIVIGRYLHRYIREHHGIELSWANFIFGNLLPDFRPAYKKLPHEKDYWTRYLSSEIGKLSASKHESASFGVNYSRRLGIICHFYADFFCYAHTEGFDGGTYPHVRYEMALHRHIRDGLPDLGRTDFGGSIARGRDAGMIMGGFASLQERYLKQAQSYDNDIFFTLRACIDTVTAITGNSVIQKKPTVGILIPGTAQV